MSIPPWIVNSARIGWHWEWNQLMNGLAPSDSEGSYLRPKSQHLKAKVPSKENLSNRSVKQIPHLIVGRSCPWAHRTWLIYKIRHLEKDLNLLIAKADHKAGRWTIDPPWLNCDSLHALYISCGAPPSHRATVPLIVDPIGAQNQKPRILGNESAQLVEVLNAWPTNGQVLDLYPANLKSEITNWQNLLQYAVNDGVYRCGFARTQAAYDKASIELFHTLEEVNQSLGEKGPWLCGEQLTLADIRLFPTLIRWEMVYAPLFGCSQKPLWAFPHLWKWRQELFAIPSVQETCDPAAWRSDYFSALFPLHPSSIVPTGPDLITMVNARPPELL